MAEKKSRTAPRKLEETELDEAVGGATLSSSTIVPCIKVGNLIIPCVKAPRTP